MKALVERAPEFPIEAGEAWTDAAVAELQALPQAKQASWIAMLGHCAQATSAFPSAKWLKSAAALMDAVGREEFKRSMLEWLPLVNEPRTRDSRHSLNLRAGAMTLTEGHMDILRGLAWMCGLAEDRALARALTALAITAFKKIPGVGSRVRESAMPASPRSAGCRGRMPWGSSPCSK